MPCYFQLARTHTRKAQRFPEESINRNVYHGTWEGKEGSLFPSLSNWPSDWDPEVRAFVVTLLADFFFFIPAVIIWSASHMAPFQTFH